MSDETIFAAALAISEPSRRDAYLDQACAGNLQLRREVEGLLRAQAASSPLDRPPAEFEPTGVFEPESDDPPPAEVGDQIGPYRLMEQIGEGGFGLVFVAEQQEPVRRKVALKVLKPGMDTREVVARFEAERQALALMDHPHIAKVLDAGQTPTGRPYFVMELVRGIPITEYCDRQKLSTQDRLALFAQVCQAVQHAHQKGIIHRDIKPSNVLVAPHDGVPVVKVIDFGVAKALGHSLTEKTIYTRFAQMIGTPLYMSPEQAEVNQLDVDTRSDIYSLGVLLYELLTGTTPFDKNLFRKAAFDEIRRIIREQEPPRPSTRLTSLGATLQSVSANRGTEPSRLTGLVRGELDWIVMKCLEKDRSRRYDTATGLAKDVQRYLAGEAVEACPPTLGYRLRKLYSRNRAAVLTGSTFAAVLLIATGVSVTFGVAANQAERRAVRDQLAAAKSAADALNAATEREAAIKYLSHVLERFNPYRYPNGIPPITVILDEASVSLDKNDELTPSVRARVRGVFGQMYVDIHEYAKGQRQLKQAYEELNKLKGPDDLETLKALEAYGIALVDGRQSINDLKLAEEKLQQVVDARLKNPKKGDPDPLKTMDGPLASAIFYQGGDAFFRMEKLRRRALAASLDGRGENDRQTSEIRLHLASVLMRSGEPENLNEARELCKRVISLYEDQNDPVARRAKYQLLLVRNEQTDFSELAKQIQQLIIEATQNGDSKESLLRMHDGLALTSLIAGKLELADEVTQKLLQDATNAYGPGHPLVRRYHGLRAWYYVEDKQYPEAEREANRIFSADFAALDQLAGGWDDYARLLGYETLAACILRRQPGGKLAEEDFKQAEEYLQQSEDVLNKAPQHLGSPSRSRAAMDSRHLRLWIELYEKWGKPENAARLQHYRAELQKLKP